MMITPIHFCFMFPPPEDLMLDIVLLFKAELWTGTPGALSRPPCPSSKTVQKYKKILPLY